MKIVLFGKTGQLGWELQRTLSTFGQVFALGRDKADLSNPITIQNVLYALKPNIVINASAYTNVDLAETQFELAKKINGLTPGIMAEATQKLGAIFIHYSTDYVFDGEKGSPYLENDPTNPINKYGISKLVGDENILQAGDAYIILRTSWVYSMHGNGFVNKVLEWARKNQTLRIVNDQTSNPTWARTLAETTSLILTQNKSNLFETIKAKRGIYHVAGAGYTSRYEWAKQIIANASNRTEKLAQTIQPALSEEFRTSAIRPRFSALDCTKFTNTFNIHLPNWQDDLKQAMMN
jgi:dTDP-4-dehydrorhamnose reductase